MSTRRRTVGHRRSCVPLELRRSNALGEAVVWFCNLGLLVLLAIGTGQALTLWVGWHP